MSQNKLYPVFLRLDRLRLLIVGAVLSGLYPGVLLARQRASEVLKGKFRQQGGGRRTRQALVLIQFIASITLIIGSVIVYQQIRFMNRQDLGLETGACLTSARGASCCRVHKSHVGA